MLLDLEREASTSNGTIGQLSADGVFLCWTLEPDEDRPQHPAIPAGTYAVVVTYSPRFGRQLPLVEVPGRAGIRVHPGNTDEDTEGCILLGTARDGETVRNSRAACQLFQSTIAGPLARGEDVMLTVTDAAVTT